MKGPMMSIKLWPVAAILALSGCALMADYKTKEDLPPPPSLSVIEDVVTRAYGRPGPRDLKIIKVGQAEILGSNEWDHYACVTTTEVFHATRRNNSGEIIRNVGDLYTQSWFMHLNLYDYGWGGGFFRRIGHGTRVGSRYAREFCPVLD